MMDDSFEPDESAPDLQDSIVTSTKRASINEVVATSNRSLTRGPKRSTTNFAIEEPTRSQKIGFVIGEMNEEGHRQSVSNTRHTRKVRMSQSSRTSAANKI